MTHIFLALILPFGFSYIASTELQSIRPQSILREVEKNGVDLSTPREHERIKAELKSGSLKVDPYMPEPFLVSLVKENALNDKKLVEAKEIARALVFQAVEKRWKYDIEYTVLNDISARSFQEFSPALIEVLREHTRFMGISEQDGKSFFRFQIADWAFVTIATNLQQAKWHIEFDSTADDNRIPEAVKNLKTKE